MRDDAITSLDAAGRVDFESLPRIRSWSRTRAWPQWLGWTVLGIVVAVLCARLGDFALIDPDEGRNVVIAQEMAAGSDWILPRLDGLPFLDKPFLFFASVATSFRLLGNSELAARLPSLLATLATLGLVLWFAARLFGRTSAWIAGLAFASSPLVAVYARTVIFDAQLTLFVCLATLAFYCAIEAEDKPVPSRGRAWTILAWAAMALGVFVKGPVALLLPLLVALPYAFLRRRLTAVLRPAGWLTLLALVGPWLMALEGRAPGFLRYALVTETWQRLTTDAMHRTGPIWYFLPILLVGTGPWILFAVGAGLSGLRGAIARARLGAEPLLFLFLWVALPLAFFSLSQSKRPGYVLPLAPAIALLAMRALVERGSSRTVVGVRLAASSLLLGAVGFLVVAAGWVELGPAPSPHLIDLLPRAALGLAVVTGVGAVLAWLTAPSARLAMVALSLPFALTPWVLGDLAGAIAEGRSSRALAAELETRLEPGDLLVGIEAYSGSLAFYLERPIVVTSATGRPFRSNSILSNYDALVGLPGRPLQRAEAWREIVELCARPTYVLTDNRHDDVHGEMERLGLPRLARDSRNTVFGPCREPGRLVREGEAARMSDMEPAR